jgi:hypothetical protein
LQGPESLSIHQLWHKLPYVSPLAMKYSIV